MPVYEPPSTTYGTPETTVIVTGSHQGGGGENLPLVESHSNHFGHAGCDGWKPIAGPVGHYVEHNDITETTGYSNVAVNDVGVGNFGAEQSISNGAGISNEQLVALALQSNQGGSIQHTEEHGGSGAIFSSVNSGSDFGQQQTQYQQEIVHQQLPAPVGPGSFQQQINLNSANLVSF